MTPQQYTDMLLDTIKVILMRHGMSNENAEKAARELYNRFQLVPN